MGLFSLLPPLEQLPPADDTFEAWLARQVERPGDVGEVARALTSDFTDPASRLGDPDFRNAVRRARQEYDASISRRSKRSRKASPKGEGNAVRIAGEEGRRSSAAPPLDSYICDIERGVIQC